MSRPNRLSCLILCALLAGTGTAAWAGPQQSKGQSEPGKGQRQRDDTRAVPAPHSRNDDRRGLAEAVRRAERATRGQVLSAERVQYDGRDLNRVKLVDDRGRVRVFWDDPAVRQERRQPRRKDGDEPRTHDDDGGSD